eukprot:Colp12_sorted_trinity150504_noHs@7930
MGDLLGYLEVTIGFAQNLNPKHKKVCKPFCIVEFEHTEVMGVASEGSSPVWNEKFIFDSCALSGQLKITVRDKAAEDVDDFLGFVKIIPSRVHDKLIEQTLKLVPRVWRDKVKGDISITTKFVKADEGKFVSIEDFELLKVLGKGSYGKVMQVKKKDTGRIYAMKILRKDHIIQRNEVLHTRAERHVLALVDSPFIVSLKFCFQTPEKIYFVLDYVHGGELFYHLQNKETLDEDTTKFYIAELVLALEHIHKLDVIYRDLKPENVLLDYNGHMVLTDFGLCKANMSHDSTTKTFCGTAEYLAPEVLKGHGYGKAIDWWALGVLMFEMLTGLPPAYSENTNTMYKKIMYKDAEIPDTLSPEAQDLLRGLLTRNDKERLGSGPADADPIRAHPFFKDISWDKLSKKELKPPFKPNLANELDTQNFDPEFTSEAPTDSVGDTSYLSQTAQANFDGFSYVTKSELANF